ncbi:MAG: MarR family winged helix-turn-helix transcriptional regulator [Geminicoccales bacterium]
MRPRQARILNALQRMGSTSQAQLAKEFGVSAGSMSSMTGRLFAKGLILRQNNPDDHRGDILSLTSSGTRMLGDVCNVWRDVDAIIKAALGHEKTADLTALTKG